MLILCKLVTQTLYIDAKNLNFDGMCKMLDFPQILSHNYIIGRTTAIEEGVLIRAGFPHSRGILNEGFHIRYTYLIIIFSSTNTKNK